MKKGVKPIRSYYGTWFSIVVAAVVMPQIFKMRQDVALGRNCGSGALLQRLQNPLYCPHNCGCTPQFKIIYY